jgi:hypothetical protein
MAAQVSVGLSIFHALKMKKNGHNSATIETTEICNPQIWLFFHLTKLKNILL